MELKPCPFCGSDRVYYTETGEQHYPDHVEGFIWCHGCGFSSDVFLAPEIAAEKWNRRANDDAIEELTAYVRQIEELRKDGYYLQKTKMMTYGQATMTRPLPEPPKER